MISEAGKGGSKKAAQGTARLLKADRQALPSADLVTDLHLPAGAWFPAVPAGGAPPPSQAAVLQLPPGSLQERLTCYHSKTGFNPTDTNTSLLTRKAKDSFGC